VGTVVNAAACPNKHWMDIDRIELWQVSQGPWSGTMH
jgi:hypothetical protein